MPPEVLSALDNPTNGPPNLTRVDVWSLGCILMEITMGVPLWFRYKCKVEVKGKPILQLAPFALTGRHYHKIIRKQR